MNMLGRTQCPLCKRENVAIIAAPLLATGAKIAEHQMRGTFWIRCPLSSSPIERRADGDV